MIRLPFSRPVAADPASPLDWRLQAWMLSALFFNLPFYFLYGGRFWMEWPLPVYVVILAVVALFLAVVFFLLPALAVHTSRKPLFETLADSVGSGPAQVVRACGVVLLILWISELLRIQRWALSQALRQEDGSLVFEGLIVCTLGFLCFTGLQRETTAARLANFSTKLGLAILIAGLVRVHVGWPEIPHGFPADKSRPAGMLIWQGLSVVALYVAPFGYFAAGWGRRTAGRRQIVAATAWGLALPLFAALLLVGISNAATHSSPYAEQGMNPNIAMAMWGGAARGAAAGYMMIAGVTGFGAIRLCFRALADSASLFSRTRLAQWLMAAMAIAVAAGLSQYLPDDRVTQMRGAATYVVVVVSAILTGDWILQRPRAGGSRWLDWVGCAALVAGVTAPWYLPVLLVGAWDDAWWSRSLLPSYGMALLICVLGRLTERARRGGLRDTRAIE
ncbi:hypothetical protein [Paludibaculum fermentans]|uniref:hypothetical protein n=1 Tax=Paludibaculum fermentans TaxID=1473598 RepID=UPI003EB769B9